MIVEASAPGKLVVLGEYAVLAGGPALAMAVDRRCTAEVASSAGGYCRLHTRAAESAQLAFAAGAGSGVDLVDRVTERWPLAAPRAWRAALDSSALHHAGGKLGLGSSAAALVAWAGAWTRYATPASEVPETAALAALHRGLQSGLGSGLDVATSRLGGVVAYRLEANGEARTSSVGLPKSVGFVAVCTGQPAETPSLLRQFDAWRASRPAEALAAIGALKRLATEGIEAVLADDSQGFLEATTEYGRHLEKLGERIGADIVTGQHRQVAACAARHGVAYKISGAGGGDMGIAFAADSEALEAFASAAPPVARILKLSVDPAGLVIRETAE
jgi:phosphomevalonate kinase